MGFRPLGFAPPRFRILPHRAPDVYGCRDAARIAVYLRIRLVFSWQLDYGGPTVFRLFGWRSLYTVHREIVIFRTNQII